MSRYDFNQHSLSHVRVETAGNLDADCELKFQIAGGSFSIDVWAKELESLKVVYRALVAVSRAMLRNNKLLTEVNASFTKQNVKIVLSPAPNGDSGLLSQQLQCLTTHNVNTAEFIVNRYFPDSYKEIFEHYLLV